eukprot:XP_001708865.1 Hypothetical protein GL50803_20849 [Giardia lamblia ATCC 50803]
MIVRRQCTGERARQTSKLVNPYRLLVDEPGAKLGMRFLITLRSSFTCACNRMFCSRSSAYRLAMSSWISACVALSTGREMISMYLKPLKFSIMSTLPVRPSAPTKKMAMYCFCSRCTVVRSLAR